MISIHDAAAIDELARRRKIDPQRVRRLRNALCKKARADEAVLAELLPSESADFAGEVELHPLRVVRRDDSRVDGATKLVLAARDEALVEAVILRMTSGRTALCVSTQVGCAAACDFCATGRMGLVRNLSAAEILDQLVHANHLLAAERRRVRNVVFMGMGEPFHNERELYRAIESLIDPRAFDLNPKRLMVSTVGIPAAMLRCARRHPDVRLALSLHSVRPEVRERLMPIGQRHALSELRQALLEVTAVQAHAVMIEYLLLADVNDTPADAQALAEYLLGIPVHVNLIPYNPISDAPHLAASTHKCREVFARSLKSAGLNVTTRYSLGRDIAAACGQLVRHEQASRALGRGARQA